MQKCLTVVLGTRWLNGVGRLAQFCFDLANVGRTAGGGRRVSPPARLRCTRSRNNEELAAVSMEKIPWGRKTP